MKKIVLCYTKDALNWYCKKFETTSRSKGISRENKK